MQENIEEHKASVQDGDARDFLDVCLQEIRKTTDMESVFYGEEAGKMSRNRLKIPNVPKFSILM